MPGDTITKAQVILLKSVYLVLDYDRRLGYLVIGFDFYFMFFDYVIDVILPEICISLYLHMIS